MGACDNFCGVAEIVEYDDVVVQGKACGVPDFLAFWFGEFFKEANTLVAEVSDRPPEESLQHLDVGGAAAGDVFAQRRERPYSELRLGLYFLRVRKF